MTTSLRTYKKYSNRRLYDVTQKSYVTVEAMVEHIQSGGQVRVLDASTQEDITQNVLLQVVLDTQKQHLNALLTTPLLHQMIQLQGLAPGKPNDPMMSDFFQNKLPQLMNAYVQWQHNTQNQFFEWAQSGWNTPSGWGMPSAWGIPPGFQTGGSARPSGQTQPPPPEKAPEKPTESLAELKAKIAELETLVKKRGVEKREVARKTTPKNSSSPLKKKGLKKEKKPR
jgi:polyhydroxyalkanoate synthesis repressor PhaR